jgi:hypothetical protein
MPIELLVAFPRMWQSMSSVWLITRGSESLLHVWHQTAPTIVNPKVICEVTLSSGPSLTL